MARMETELSTLRNAASRPAAPQGINHQELVRAMTLDPLGTMQKLGIPVDHVTRVAVTHALGDQATPEQKALAGLGPQISATNALASTVENLSRRFDEQDKRATTQANRTSLQKLIENKAKYPYLAKAFEADASLFESDVESYKGDAAVLADTLEARQAKLAAAYGVKLSPPASDGNADNKAAQSAQSKPANGSSITEVPPLPQPSKPGVFNDDEHQKLKREILAKYPDPTPTQ